MKSLIIVLLTVLGMQNAHAEFISRYSSRTFPKDGGIQPCLQELQKITNALSKIADITVLGSECKETSWGGFVAYVDYDHPFTKRIEAYTKTFYLKQACETSLPNVTKAFVRADLVPVSSYCTSSQEIHVDYIRTGKFILNDYAASPKLLTAAECDSFLTGLLHAFDSNGVMPVLTQCYPVQIGLSKVQEFKFDLVYAVELGKDVHVLRGQSIQTMSQCQDGTNDVANKMAAENLPVIAVHCENYSGKLYQFFTYLDGIYSRVKTYESLNFKTSQACEASLLNAVMTFEKSKRRPIFSYCDESGDQFKYFLHYLEPKIEDPAPNPSP